MFPRKVGSAWEVYTPAKLNLYLEVLSQQASGYHELETLMVPVGICDRLHWTPAETATVETCATDRDLQENGLRISCSPATNSGDSDWASSQIPPGGDNLVMRAANRLAQHAGIRPHGTFTLHKRIPIQAGLGGGSSDAAAALILANQAWDIGYPKQRLMELASQIGSDVPYFVTLAPEKGSPKQGRLAQGAAVCRGRGERVEPIGSLGRLHFVIVKPPVGISTADLFAKVACQPIPDARAKESPKRLARLIDALRSGNLTRATQWITNRLEVFAETICDALGPIRGAMIECGCAGRCMTGSGSAYVGVVRTAKQAKHIAGLLTARKLGTVFTTMNYY